MLDDVERIVILASILSEADLTRGTEMRMPPYIICLAGIQKANRVTEVTSALEESLSHQDMVLGADVGFVQYPDEFSPPENTASVVLFFGGPNTSIDSFRAALGKGVPCLPIVSDLNLVSSEIPAELSSLNCIAYRQAGPSRIASATMEALGLLPRQRNLFLSYRRSESSSTAEQLFNILSERQFDVFLDTHGVLPGEEFQAVLWHRLCACDVMVMLDTNNYFESRWTVPEYGRALAKGISVLRIGWPGVKASCRTSLAHSIELGPSDILKSNHLSARAVNLVKSKVEEMRSLSKAARTLNVYGQIEESVKKIGGRIKGLGPKNSVEIVMPNGKQVLLVLALGVPNSNTLQDAEIAADGKTVAVIYDHVGLLPAWQSHLSWLGGHVSTVRWMKAAEVAWDLPGLEAH